MDALAMFLQLSIQLGTPLLFATLGGILCERGGHLNLGIEGMMMTGALFGFHTAYATSNPFLAVLAAALAGLVTGLIYALITVSFRGNQTVTGFAITIFGAGFANFIGKGYSNLILSNEFIASLGTKEIPGLSKIPLIGTALFKQSILVPVALVAAILLWIYMYKTRYGLNMRMVGEDAAAADASGIHVTLYKYIHIALGGALCGIGGGYLSLVYVPRWQDDITAGMGWIAVALVIFATWNPMKAIFGAYLFGIFKGLAIKFQNVTFHIGGLDVSLTSQIMDMLPYLMTIIVLVLTTLSRKRENQAPAGIGKPYFREDR